MEEILASIRRIIADEDTAKTVKPAAVSPAPVKPPEPKLPDSKLPESKPAEPAVVASRPAPVSAPANNQNDIDAMLADVAPAPKAPPQPAAAVPPPQPEQPADVLDLTEAMATPASAFRTIDAASDVVFTDRLSDVPYEPTPRDYGESRRQPPPSTPSDYQGLISNQTMSAVDSAFNSLAHTVLGNNARTLEDLVKEMLRPMLKGWLDDNLPNMVERIVRAEIERVSRGRN